MLRRKRLWLAFAASGAFLALFFYRVDAGELVTALRGANYVYLLPALPVYFLGVWFRAWRWQILLRPLVRVSHQRLFSIVIIGYMANDILPARLGELVRAYILGERERTSKAAILATVAVERVFDGLALLVLMALISAFVPLEGFLGTTLRLAGALFGGITIALLVVASRKERALRLADLGLRLAPSRLRLRVRHLLELFLDGLAALKSPWLTLAVLLTSAVGWLLEAGAAYIVMLSFDFRVPYHVLVLATAVANLATTVPSMPGGIGPFDLLFKQALVAFDVDAGVAAAYTVVLHAFLLLPVILLGFVFLWVQGISWSQVSRGEQLEQVTADRQDEEKGIP